MSPTKSSKLMEAGVFRDASAVPYPGLEQRLVLATRSPHQPEQVQRLAQYESYFEAALGATRHEHPDFEDLSRATAKAKQAVRRCQEESDLERIQDLFPNDSLCLYDKDAVTMKMKGLMRKRSTTAARLQRALSTKGSPRDEPPPEAPRPEKRQFLMETAVQFTTGMQSQERHLFLFSDLLLVAKARSGGNFKLKEKVRVSEMWLSRCVDDVTEVARSHETSMVLGWPTTNVVATFGTQAARDLWWAKLSEVIAAEREKEPRCTNIQVVYYDVSTNIEYCKTFSVTANETARCCIRLALEHLEMRGLDPSQFQLWASTGRDEAPYPLIGHERPFAIKLSCLRDGLSAEEGFDLDHCNNIYGTDPLTRCRFILRNVRKLPDFASSPCEAKKSKKSRKSPMRIKQVFRRSVKGEDSVDCGSPSAPGALFGLPLQRVCAPDGSPPPAVMAMLQQVFAKGPFTQGIFRKSANARLVREAREQLDAGASPASLEHVPVLVTAALLKDFLRSLPEPLLAAALYQDWLEAIECQSHDSEQDRLIRVKSVLDRLPTANHCLLAHFLCVLHHVARRSSLNLMTAGNLGVCVGPSLLWGPCPTPASSRAVPALVEMLISRCETLMGSSVTRLMGDPPERDPLRQDSGAEESDSLHSGGLRRDDSSIDSLEREELLEPSPPPRKDKMSLSRDSGLTLSDSQLYTPDEEESGSTSSGLSGDTKAVRGGIYRPQPPANSTPRYDHAKLTATFSHPGTVSAQQPVPQTREYVRVYGGWEERIECCRKGADESVYGKTRHSTPINSNFQRQDWFRQRSHLKRLNSGSKQSQNSSSCSSSSSSSSSGSGGNGNSNGDVTNHCNGNLLRRSASEESLLNSYNVSCSGKRPALHGKGRAPPPPAEKSQNNLQTPLSRRRHMQQQQQHQRFSSHYALSRSKSAHHLCSEVSDMMCNDPLSQSLPVKPAPKTPVIQSEDWARSQSTPHIAAAAALSLDEVERSYDSSTLSDDDSTPHVSRSNSRGKDCPTAANTIIPSWDSFNIPPSYEETMTRRSSDLVRAAPVMATDSDPEVPPLPPKQRRSPTDNSTVKLRHLPPVHVKLEGSSSPNSPSKKPLRPMSYHPGDNGTCVVEPLYAPVPRARRTCVENKVEENKSETKCAPERRGRLRRRDASSGSSQRSKSLPPTEKQVESEEEVSQERRDSSPVRSTNKQGEISWSVSQLRSLFGDSRPPPYRPPPRVVTIPSHRAPITSFHLGNSQSELHVARLLDCRRELSRADSADSTSEEESYV